MRNYWQWRFARGCVELRLAGDEHERGHGHVARKKNKHRDEGEESQGRERESWGLLILSRAGHREGESWLDGDEQRRMRARSLQRG